MAIQHSTTLRNNRIGQIESTAGTTPKLRLFSGSPPADCATAASGTLIATLDLPSDWLGAASAGSVSKAGTWTGTASAAGTAGYYRILDSGATTTHEQGTVGLGSGDLSLDNNVISNGQTITISTWVRTEGNA